MRGGKTYNVKVIAQVAGNSAVDPVEASITITTRSMDLIPVIRKGPVIVIGRCKEAFTDSWMPVALAHVVYVLPWSNIRIFFSSSYSNVLRKDNSGEVGVKMRKYIDSF